MLLPLPSNSQHLSNDDCLSERYEGILLELFSAVLRSTVVHSDIHIFMSSFTVNCLLWPPCAADADIIFLPCRLLYLLSFFLA